MLPRLRTKLSTISSKNKSLQDLLHTCSDSAEVMDIQPNTGGIHNTKLTVELKSKEPRVHFYNRLDIKNIIPQDLDLPCILPEVIFALNTQHGCDFTEDDLEFGDRILKAKEKSLGYIGSIPFISGADHVFLAFYDLSKIVVNDKVWLSEDTEINYEQFLLDNGIKIIETYDRISCHELKLVQNISKKCLDVQFYGRDWDIAGGFEVLPEQKNESIKKIGLIDEWQFPMYMQVNFTLCQNSTFKDVDIPMLDQMRSSYYDMTLTPTLNGYDATKLKLKITVNGTVLSSGLITDEYLQSIEGVLNEYFTSNGYNANADVGVSYRRRLALSVTPNEEYKLLNFVFEMEYLDGNADAEDFVFDSGVYGGVMTVEGNRKVYRFTMFDPIDLLMSQE